MALRHVTSNDPAGRDPDRDLAHPPAGAARAAVADAVDMLDGACGEGPQKPVWPS